MKSSIVWRSCRWWRQVAVTTKASSCVVPSAEPANLAVVGPKGKAAVISGNWKRVENFTLRRSVRGSLSSFVQISETQSQLSFRAQLLNAKTGTR